MIVALGVWRRCRTVSVRNLLPRDCVDCGTAGRPEGCSGRWVGAARAPGAAPTTGSKDQACHSRRFNRQRRSPRLPTMPRRLPKPPLKPPLKARPRLQRWRRAGAFRRCARSSRSFVCSSPDSRRNGAGSRISFSRCDSTTRRDRRCSTKPPTSASKWHRSKGASRRSRRSSAESPVAFSAARGRQSHHSLEEAEWIPMQSRPSRSCSFWPC